MLNEEVMDLDQFVEIPKFLEKQTCRQPQLSKREIPSKRSKTPLGTTTKPLSRSVEYPSLKFTKQKIPKLSE